MTQTLTSAIDVARQATLTLRAVIYARVSTEEQKKGFGITYSVKKGLRHIEKKGWAHVETFKDEGYSGSLDHTKRPDLKRLMELSRQEPRPFDVVVVTEERAIGRRDRAFWPWVWALEDLGIFVAVVRGDYDNTTEAGRSKMRKEQDRAEDERITIRDRTQGGVQEKAEVGGHPGGVAPYGYRIENQGKRGESRIVPDDGEGTEGVPTLWRMFSLIVTEGHSPSEVEDLLNAESHPGPSGDGWKEGAVRHVLTTEAVQKGRRTYRNPKARTTRVNDDGQPIFGDTVVIEYERIFNDAQIELLNIALARTTPGPRATANIHPLSEHVFCPCGAHYTGASNTGRDDARVYRCNGRIKKRKTKCSCNCAQINAEALEDRVWVEICQLLENPQRLVQMAEEWLEVLKGSDVDYEGRIENLNSQIEDMEAAIDGASAAAAVRAAKRKLDKQATQGAIERATATLNTELDDLVKLRDEAQQWHDEAKRAELRARDLTALSAIARENLHGMTALEREDVVDLLKLKVTILGPAPRRTRTDDGISSWFRERDLVVPELTDAAWAAVEPILTEPKRGRRPKDPRGLLDAMLQKARTGCPWQELSYGNVSSIWQRWTKNGLWERVMALLAPFPGVLVREPIVLPQLRVEGLVDPRLFISGGRNDDQDDVLEGSRSRTIPFLMELAV